MASKETRMGSAILEMLSAAEDYAQWYEAVFDSKIGTDGVLGDDGMRQILRGIDALLNGPLGRFDGGTLSKAIYKAAKDMDLLDESGEF